MSLQATADLAADPLFQARVQAAMITAALQVATEAIGTMTVGDYGLRHTLATQILQGNPGQGRFVSGMVPWVSQFCWAVASNTTVAADLGAPVLIASTTDANPAQVTTASAHGLASGAFVEIAGATDPAVNGCWPVTVIDAENFTIPVPGTITGTAGGTVTVQPDDNDIEFAVDSVFGSIAGVGSAV